MPQVTMDLEDFTTLASWAEQHGTANDMYPSIRKLLSKIEDNNSLSREFLIVRWRDASAGPPSGFPTDWPPMKTLELARYSTPWTYEEVVSAVGAITANPVTIEVTRDRTGAAGWFDLNTFFGR